MKKKTIFRGAAVSFLLVTMVLVTTAFVDKYHYVDKKLQAIEAVLKDYYVGDIDEQKLEEGIYKGFVAGVGDAYTNYYTSDEYASFKEKSSGMYAGIGIQMTLQTYDNSIEVTEVFEGSPAEKAGIKPKDRIIKAAGKRVTGDEFEILPTLVKGTPGTTVDITVYRPSEEKNYDFTIERASVASPTVYFRMLDNEVGYIQIKQFEAVTYDQFKVALDKLKKEKAKGLVLDLRDNPGGLLNIVEQIADELVPEGIIVSTKDKQGKGSEYYADSKYTDIPMVVLINGNSASASEVLAGALKDYSRAELIGTTTFGKGVVQTIIPLSDGSAIKLTTSQYFTPSGVCIQGIGIAPDYEVKLSTEKILKGRELTDTEDDQLQTAIKVVKEKLK
ncbi:S41 family peptidase [Cellulosilyticum sp. ST5]|uniref:S41 family peptidase n=1 Tax=unclassified Cellulosilyticum TaxID=2643091 RepID=UPI000F8D2330|nr:S41 family peptidase [Cellulosilyticum sp. WCF-2]QEH70735.1 S41 family peptidase [Cellulosilyticum sp. WCF-2]